MLLSSRTEVAAEVAEAHLQYSDACAYHNRQEAGGKRKVPLTGAAFVHEFCEFLQLFRGYPQRLR